MSNEEELKLQSVVKERRRNGAGLIALALMMALLITAVFYLDHEVKKNDIGNKVQDAHIDTLQGVLNAQRKQFLMCKNESSKKAGCSTPVAPPASVINGPQGLQGLQGLQGTSGAQGLQGLLGPRGLLGPQGIQGIQGETGKPGLTGAQGTSGPPGNPGLNGDTGSVGPKGETGAPGTPGKDGAPGKDGTPGPKGDTGSPGVVTVSSTCNPVDGQYVTSVNLEYSAQHDLTVTCTQSTLPGLIP